MYISATATSSGEGTTDDKKTTRAMTTAADGAGLSRAAKSLSCVRGQWVESVMCWEDERDGVTQHLAGSKVTASTGSVLLGVQTVRTQTHAHQRREIEYLGNDSDSRVWSSHGEHPDVEAAEADSSAAPGVAAPVPVAGAGGPVPELRLQAAAVGLDLSPGAVRPADPGLGRPQLRLRQLLHSAGLLHGRAVGGLLGSPPFRLHALHGGGALPVVSYVVLVFLVCFAAFSLPLDFGLTVPGRQAAVRSPVEGVWETVLVVFMVYSMMPLRTIVAAILGVLLPVLHLALSALIANAFPASLWRQLENSKKLGGDHKDLTCECFKFRVGFEEAL
ncbi:hypothetical protein C0Q70_10423 [Pomacea canaliculata]|uniref:Adenylate cyclase N-terminal domain-containing protein n=1 Tax=Pomacea canaliculata TaxID=400727 RepID=A0A2T7PCK3_POMCA|nr:hypothetical protein C0Q70_10423 [Pomacea canaliculata]